MPGSNHARTTIDLPLARVHGGKVREVFALGDDLLLVATDRLSAFDIVFDRGIPDKGRVLTGLSDFWLDRLAAAVLARRRLPLELHLVALGLDARAAGGWAELQFMPGMRWAFHAGASIDDVTDSRRALLPRRRNRSAYGNVIVTLTPEVQASFEYRWLATVPITRLEGRNHHFDWVLAYSF